MRLVLVGYMASGKSTIGKKLSKKLNIPFYDLDEYIVNNEKLKIKDIFKKKGEVYFRKKEAEYLDYFLKNNDNFILAVGGGTPCYGNNMSVINNNSKSIYLKTSIQSIYDKLSKEKNKHKRPLISTIANKDLREFIAKHLFERVPFYEQATFTVNTTAKTKKEIVNEISLNMQ